jgi:tetraacyldisaccharide 4'-kinase
MQPRTDSILPRLSRPFLNLLSLPFKTIALINLKIRALRPQAFPGMFIISVDSLSFGGAGKTPMVIAIGKALEARGAKFAIISRGYRSLYEKAGLHVEPTHTCQEVGDEPVLLKNRFPNQDVFIGRDRLRSIAAAANRNNRILILDDGFQSSHIQKDCSVMLVNPNHPYFYLRQFRFLSRRDDFVLTYRRFSRETVPPAGATYDFAITKFLDAGGQEVKIDDAPVIAFSALGDNERFAVDMRRYRLIDFRGFADHHAYRKDDIRSLEKMRKDKGATWMVCTEKDFCKINHLLPSGTPLLYARNEIKLPDDAIGRIIQHAAEKSFI